MEIDTEEELEIAERYLGKLFTRGSLKEDLKSFICCVAKGEKFTITPLQALNNLRVCEAIRQFGRMR